MPTRNLKVNTGEEENLDPFYLFLEGKSTKDYRIWTGILQTFGGPFLPSRPPPPTPTESKYETTEQRFS